MGTVLLFACAAALNPTLLAVTTVILLLPEPKPLLIGYLIGAMMTSITLGLLIVFKLQGTGIADTAQNTLSPAANFAFGGIFLAIAYVLATGRDRGMSERRAKKKAAKGPGEPPRWQRFLNRGSARDAFVVGALLTLPGASYLAGLSHLAGEDVSDAVTVLMVVVFNVIMMTLLELPTIAYVIAPETTPARVDRFKATISRHGRRGATYGTTIVGSLLVIRGAIELVS
jgi:Sap, sulfolipid-1-addressing protein